MNLKIMVIVNGTPLGITPRNEDAPDTAPPDAPVGDGEKKDPE